MSWGYVWQDMLITLAQLLMLVALAPSVAASAPKPAFETSVLTAVGLGLMLIAFAALTLYLSAVFVAAMMVLWIVIAINTKRQKVYNPSRRR